MGIIRGGCNSNLASLSTNNEDNRHQNVRKHLSSYSLVNLHIALEETGALRRPVLEQPSWLELETDAEEAMLSGKRHACKRCSQRIYFKSRRELKQHMQDSHGTEGTHISKSKHILKCNHCQAPFANLQALRVHLRLHADRIPFLCLKCGKSFNQRYNLKMHMRLHTGELYRCPVCNATFNIKANFERHMGSHENKRSFVCTECGRPFLARHHLEAHMVTHTGAPANYKCSFCPSKYHLKNNLARHVRIVHRDRVLTVTKAEQMKTKCTICNRTFSSNYTAQRHIARVHKDVKHLCPYCFREFDSNTAVLKHSAIVHHEEMALFAGNNQNTPNLTRNFKCALCETAFTTKTNLNRHVQSKHSGKKQHVCPTCGNEYARKDTLELHIRAVHQGKDPSYKCSLCSRKVFTRLDLSNHMRLHKGEHPYSCEICGAVFVQKGNLKRHMVLHSGNKNDHVCDICSRGFVLKSYLDAHKSKMHPELREFKCTMCPQVFKRKNNLLIHMYSHQSSKDKMSND